MALRKIFRDKFSKRIYKITGMYKHRKVDSEKIESQSFIGKPQVVTTFQNLTAVIDSSDLCLFTSLALDANDYNGLINSDTGYNLNTGVGLKIYKKNFRREKKCRNVFY